MIKIELFFQLYYDDKLKRWVDKNATEEEQAPPPPPPKIPMMAPSGMLIIII